MKMRKNIVSVLAMLLVLLLTVGSFGAAFAETAATTKPLSELTQEDIDYLRSLLVTEDGPLMGEELLAHINAFTGEELYWTLAAVSDEQYASLQEILTEEELTALFAPLHEMDGLLPRNYTYVAAPIEYDTGVYALAAAADDSEDDNQSDTPGLYLKKTAEFDSKDYTGDITLEAYVEGAVSTTTDMKPCDIVLVLDISSSMKNFSFNTEIYAGSLDTTETYYVKSNNNYYSVTYDSEAGLWKRTSGGTTVTPMESATDSDDNHVQFYISSSENRLAGLKYAARNFVKQVKANADENNVDHRISIVTFNSAANVKTTLANGSVRTKSTELINTINGLSTSTGTNSAHAMTKAKEALTTANGMREGSSRVVVFFTDGAPSTAGNPSSSTYNTYNHNHGSYSTGDSGFNANVADSAIDFAYDLKNPNGNYKATIYSIGVFDAANPGDTTKYAENMYMHRVSSNCMADTECFQSGAITQNGYYQSAGDVSTLTKIFADISESVTSGAATVKLNETTVITDTISPTFELPEGTDASKIKVYTQASTAQDTWATERVELKTTGDDKDVTVTVSGKTVTVTGFDFQANYVGEHAADGVSTGWAGKKLIIEIPFEPTAGYFGGNELATNTAAKIENAESKFFEEFGAPTVDVPLRYEIAAQDQAIYLSNTADLSTIMQYVEDVPSTYVCDNDSVDYKPNGTNNADVDIVYTLKDSAKNTVATLTIPRGTAASDCSWVWAEDVDNTPVLTADEKYTVSCTVTPVTTGTYSAIEKTAEGNVYVYKPQVTANDKTVDYGAVVTLKDQVVGEVKWTHPQDATIDNLLDTTKKPSTVLTFKVNDAVATTATVTAETPVEITLGLNDPQATFDFMPHTTFVRNAMPCDFETCDAQAETSHIGTAEACEFKLHLGTISGVKVKKVVTGNMANRNQEFEFTATYADQTVNFRLAHDGEHELKNLPIGTTLTITEVQTGYTTTVTADGATKDGLAYTDMIAADDAGKVITFNNHKEAEIDTGISLDSLPYILLLAVVAAGVLFFVVRRKRSED